MRGRTCLKRLLQFRLLFRCVRFVFLSFVIIEKYFFGFFGLLCLLFCFLFFYQPANQIVLLFSLPAFSSSLIWNLSGKSAALQQMSSSKHCNWGLRTIVFFKKCLWKQMPTSPCKKNSNIRPFSSCAQMKKAYVFVVTAVMQVWF